MRRHTRATIVVLSSFAALLLGGAAHGDEITGWGGGATGTYGSQIASGWTQASTGYITLFNDPTGQTACVDVWGGGSAAQSGVGMWSCNGGGNQSWKVTTKGQIVGIDNECLDLPHSSTTPGTRLQLFPCNGGTNQQWFVYADHTIRSAVDSSHLCLALPSGSNVYTNPNQGLALTIDTCNPSSSNQQWMVHGVGEIVGAGGQEFDIPGGNTTNGTALDTYAAVGGANEKWTFESPGIITGLNGKCIDTAGGSVAAGTALVINDCNINQLTQYWGQNGDTIISLTASSMCVTGGSNSPLTLQPCDGRSAQKWVYTQPLTVPLVVQQESNWCWIGVAEMTMKYLGNLGSGTPTQCQAINKRLGFTGSQNCCTTLAWNDTTSYGGTVCNHPGGVNDVLNDWGFGFTCGSGPSSFSTLQSEIAAGRPVPFAIGWNAGGGHALLVIGAWTDSAGTQWLTINDPWGVGASSQGDQFLMKYSTYANTNNMVGTFTTGRTLTNVAYGSTGTCN